MRLFHWVVVTLVLGICFFFYLVMQPMTIQLNSVRLKIPQKNLVYDSVSVLEGVGNEVVELESLLVYVPIISLSDDIREFEGPSGKGVLVYLHALGSTGDKYLQADYPLYSDAWYGGGKYENRKVERLDSQGFYKVYDPDINFYWSALSIPPVEGAEIPGNIFDFWVGHCRVSYDGRSICRMNGVYKDKIYFTYTIYDSDLIFHNDIRQVIVSKLGSWQIN